jgi:superfamily II DNA or RNA helicase
MRRIKTHLIDVVRNVYGDANTFRCFAGCGAILSIDTPKILHRGHVIAHANGGDDSVDNLRPECESCNLSHGTQHMFEYMKTYGLSPPVADRGFINCTAIQLEPRIFEQRLIRVECHENAKRYYESHGDIRGIISAPTGAGKTLMAMEIIGDMLRLKDGVILWITERKDIIGTQFTPHNVHSWKAAGIIPRETSILFRSHLKYCTQFPDKCIIASTIDTAMNHFDKLKKNANFLGIIVDETHMAGGDKTFEMIMELSPYCKILVGLSATHKFDSRMDILYGTGGKLSPENVFLEYNYMQAIRDGVIRQVDFKISRANRVATDIEGTCLFDRVESDDRRKIFDQLISISNSTKHRKGIIWCGSIRAAEKWHQYFSCQAGQRDGDDFSCQAGQRDGDDFSCQAIGGAFSHGKTTPEANQYTRFLLDHSYLSPQRSRIAFEDFCRSTNVIMISARKHSQGVDVPDLDFGAIIEDSGTRDVRNFLQMVGRLTRNSADSTANAIFCEFIVSSSEEEYTRTMKTLIDEYYHGICERFSPEACFASQNDLNTLTPTGFEMQRSGGSHVATIKHADAPGIQFEILDGLTDIDIFSRDEEFIANLLCRTGRCGVDYRGIKEFLKLAGITEPAEAEMLFRELYAAQEWSPQFTITHSGRQITITEKMHKAIIAWWDIVRYMGINYNLLLDIDNNLYYKTLAEARRAINIAERQLSLSDVKSKTDREIYNSLRVVDNKLHINPVDFYESINNFSEYYSPNRKKWLVK